MVKEGTFIAINTANFKVGQIKNISYGGLSFTYVGRQEQIPEAFSMDIFAADGHFFLKNLPFKTVADFYLADDIAYSTITLRQRGGQFGELTAAQTDRLNYFMKAYTMERRAAKERRQGQSANYGGPERRTGRERRRSAMWS